MIVIATGPRSNGTTLLYQILTSGSPVGKTALHLPVYPPEVEYQSWAWELPNSPFVIIERSKEMAVQSALRRGLSSTLEDAVSEQDKAREYLRHQKLILGSRYFDVQYEHLIQFPDEAVERIWKFLISQGWRGPRLTYPEIRDENAKYIL